MSSLFNEDVQKLKLKKFQSLLLMKSVKFRQKKCFLLPQQIVCILSAQNSKKRYSLFVDDGNDLKTNLRCVHLTNEQVSKPNKSAGKNTGSMQEVYR